VRNNADVRKILTDRNIRPEALPPGEDLRRVARRLKADEKQLPRAGGRDSKRTRRR
jgi:DNA-damage-inducible protein D